MNTESQTDRITQLEAACALKTELLRAVRYSMDRPVPFPSLEKITEAINSEGGKSLLERLNKAEVELVIANQSLFEIQPALGKLKDRLQAVERDNGLLKEQIRIADVAYQSLHERHQAVEKSHTALRLASEELIACVRHGDQEDIGEAMAKIESILQPAQKEQQ